MTQHDTILIPRVRWAWHEVPNIIRNDPTENWPLFQVFDQKTPQDAKKMWPDDYRTLSPWYFLTWIVIPLLLEPAVHSWRMLNASSPLKESSRYKRTRSHIDCKVDRPRLFSSPHHHYPYRPSRLLHSIVLSVSPNIVDSINRLDMMLSPRHNQPFSVECKVDLPRSLSYPHLHHVYRPPRTWDA